MTELSNIHRLSSSRDFDLCITPWGCQDVDRCINEKYKIHQWQIMCPLNNRNKYRSYESPLTFV
jgi:hypothetical protein